MFVNNSIGSFLESNKRKFLPNFSMKKLLYLIGNILPTHLNQARFKNIPFSRLHLNHQTLLFNNGFININGAYIQISYLSTIKDK